MNEIWKDIPEYDGLYQISNIGNVKSLSREICNSLRCYISKEKILKQKKNPDGYYTVNLCNNNNCKTFRIHKLVAIAFLNHIPCGYELVIDHINDIKTDNRVENLQIVTQRFNVKKTQGKYSSKYKGVCWDKHARKWISRIVINKIKVYLGLFNCELAAHVAYQNKLKQI